MMMLGYTLSERTRKVLMAARDEAQGFKHDYVGTEHILLGLIRERDDVAGKVLQSLNVDLDAVRQKIEKAVEKGTTAHTTEPQYTVVAKKVLEFAMMEARELNHTYVGTEHLLLGMLREAKGIAAKILNEAGVTLESARAEIRRVLPGDMAQGGTAAAGLEGTHDRPTTGLRSGATIRMTHGYNFTERVRKVIAAAREAARDRHHDYVETEHILLGLIRERDDVAGKVLQSLNLDLDGIQQKIEEVVNGKPAQTTGHDIPYSSRAKKVLELAMNEASELNHNYVGTEHLLLGLLREEQGIAARVLAEAGVKVEAARAEIRRVH